MALNKSVRQSDGVTTMYHRILYVCITTNRQNSIAVLSYTDSEARSLDNANDITPYVKSKTYETDYDETMSISKAYEYLKTLPEFDGATDV